MDRHNIVEEALTWLNTPYHAHAQIKGAGVDCGMLPLAVYQSCHLVPKSLIVEHYSPDFYKHRSEEMYLGFADKFGVRINYEDVQPGDFGLWRFGRVYSHGGIFINKTTIIHAALREGKVILSDISKDQDLNSLPVLFFKPKGL